MSFFTTRSCLKFSEESCVQPGKYHNGSPLDRFYDIESYQRCWELCQESQACYYWRYNWDNQECERIKQESGNYNSNQNYISGPKYCSCELLEIC